MNTNKELKGNNIITFIKKNTWLKRGYGIDFGWGNGYIVINKDHPCFGMNYDTIYQKYNINCESELTYAESAEDNKWEELHERYKNKDYWIIGFDTMHYKDTLLTWPKDRVRVVADKLAFKFLEIWIQHKRKDIDFS